MTGTFTVAVVTEQSWAELRGLRLEMLADTPIAYGESRETAALLPEEEWRGRARRGQSETSTLLVAVEEHTDRWIGTMGAFLAGGDIDGPLLVGVYVNPDHRGRTAGVADALLDGIETWARDHGTSLTLHVHEDNPRAITFYERRGFTLTGGSIAYNLDPGRRELEMRREFH